MCSLNTELGKQHRKDNPITNLGLLNHRIMGLVERDLKDHLFPSPLP